MAARRDGSSYTILCDNVYVKLDLKEVKGGTNTTVSTAVDRDETSKILGELPNQISCLINDAEFPSDAVIVKEEEKAKAP